MLTATCKKVDYGMPANQKHIYKYHYAKIYEDTVNNWLIGFADETACNEFDFAPKPFGLDLGYGALGPNGRPILHGIVGHEDDTVTVLLSQWFGTWDESKYQVAFRIINDKVVNKQLVVPTVIQELIYQDDFYFMATFVTDNHSSWGDHVPLRQALCIPPLHNLNDPMNGYCAWFISIEPIL